jgi:hypothetical protein
VSNLFSSAVESYQASQKQSQDLQLSFMKEMVESLATTMNAMQKTNPAFMLEMIKAFTDKGSSQRG